MTTTSASTDPTTTTHSISRPDGHIAYDLGGTGPLVLLVPGMGDLRSTYRFLAPPLRDAGYRVACADLRGHGDSDAGFTSYGDIETAGDIVALVNELGAPAVVVGNSMAAGAAVIAAAQRPELVAGLVLVGPFVRNGDIGVLTRVLLRAAMTPPWAAAAWNAYLPKLYAGRRPDDFATYRAQVIAGLRRPGHQRAFARTTRLSHAPAEARLSDVAAPTLVVMGERDPDFADPRAEAEWIAKALNGEFRMVPEAGHYPQSQQPELVLDAMLPFLARVTQRA